MQEILVDKPKMCNFRKCDDLDGKIQEIKERHEIESTAIIAMSIRMVALSRLECKRLTAYRRTAERSGDIGGCDERTKLHMPPRAKGKRSDHDDDDKRYLVCRVWI
jgi:hypothetical protein